MSHAEITADKPKQRDAKVKTEGQDKKMNSIPASQKRDQDRSKKQATPKQISDKPSKRVIKHKRQAKTQRAMEAKLKRLSESLDKLTESLQIFLNNRPSNPEAILEAEKQMSEMENIRERIEELEL